MIITCGQCQAKFKIAPSQIKESGSKVRCSNCQHIFTVYRPQPGQPPEQEAECPTQLLHETPEDDSGDYKARRERRRQLYSDLEDEPGKAASDDSLENYDEDDEEDGQAPNPPLRRAGRGRGEEPPRTEDDGALPPPLEERAGKDSLGLDSDPVHREAAPGQSQGSPIRGAAEASPSGKNPQIFLVLAIVATALLVGLYFMANRPEPTALSMADQLVGQENAGPAAPGTARPEPDSAGAADPGGTLGIAFSKNNQNHYFRENVKEGTILIITGMVRNNYPERRSFIHLRGRLVSADDSTLADRYAYAGNLVSEDELINLPISEIFSRLSIKGGQNGQNMNIEPGREVPFMLVFDKLPDGMTEYRIDPMGSTPSE